MAEDLHLEDLLTPEELAHYQKFLGGHATIFIHPDPHQDWKWTATTVSDSQPAAARYAIISPLQERESTEGVLVRHGYGPDTASSSVELALSPQISWDVCGYYSRLGLHWRATKKEIRQALLRLQAELTAGDASLTYAATQLLDDDVRRRYDRVPLGQLFLEDKDTEEMIKREAHMAAAAAAARGFIHVTTDDVLASWGMKATPRGGPEGEGQGPVAPPLQDPPLLGRPFMWSLRWAWYAEPETRHRLRTTDLEDWQYLLVSAFAKLRIRTRFAVGIADIETFEIRTAPDQTTVVILLGRGEPTARMAADAAAMWARLETQS